MPIRFKNHLPLLKPFAASLLLACMVSGASEAATLYFTGDDSSPGGAGTWDAATTASWSQNSDGSGTLVSWDTGGNDIAVLSHPSLGSAPNVTLNSDVSLTELHQNRASGGISGGFALNFTGSSVIRTLTSGGALLVSNTGGISVGDNGLNVVNVNGSVTLGRNINGDTLGGIISFDGSSTDIRVDTGTFRVMGSVQLPSTTRLYLDNNADFLIRDDNTIAGLDGSGTGSRIYRDLAAFVDPQTLTISRSSGTSTFSGYFYEDDAPGNEDPINLVKGGGFTQILNGSVSSTAPGDTTVNGGILRVAAADGITPLAIGDVTVGAGTLELQSGRIDAPTLTLSDASSYVEINSGGVAVYDDIVFSTAGGIYNFNGGTTALFGDWDLASLTGITDSTFQAQGDSNLDALTFTSGTGEFDGYTLIGAGVVPEPSSLTLLLLGAGLFWLRHKVQTRSRGFQA